MGALGGNELMKARGLWNLDKFQKLRKLNNFEAYLIIG